MSKQGHVEELCTYIIVKQYLNNIYVYTSQLRCFVYTLFLFIKNTWSKESKFDYSN